MLKEFPEKKKIKTEVLKEFENKTWKGGFVNGTCSKIERALYILQKGREGDLYSKKRLIFDNLVM